jgi:hypothetical protein
MIFYDIAFSCFSHRVSGVFAQAFIIYIFRFFPLDFLKIVFIMYDVQMLNGECYNTIFRYDDVYNAPATADMLPIAGATARLEKISTKKRSLTRVEA